MMKNFRMISVILILILALASTSFATTVDIKESNYSYSTLAASSATLIRMGGNWQLWDGIPSAYASQSWSSWQSYNDTLSAYSISALTYEMADSIIAGFGGWWSVIGIGFLANDVNQMGTAAFFQNIINSAPLVNGVKTSYSRVYESHASSFSGTQQFSKVYIRYYTNSARTIIAGTSETLFLYAWPTGSSPER